MTPLEDLNRATSNVRYHQIFFFGERAAQLGGRRRAFTNPDGVLGAPRGIDLDAGNTLARLEWLQASTAEYSVKSFAKDADNTISAHIGVCG